MEGNSGKLFLQRRVTSILNSTFKRLNVFLLSIISVLWVPNFTSLPAFALQSISKFVLCLTTMENYDVSDQKTPCFQQYTKSTHNVIQSAGFVA